MDMMALLNENMEASFKEFLGIVQEDTTIPEEIIPVLRNVFRHGFMSGSAIVTDMHRYAEEQRNLSMSRIMVN